MNNRVKHLVVSDHCTPPTQGRSNAEWIADLEGPGIVQERALEDLRRCLLRGLHKSIGGRAASDHMFLDDVVQEALMVIIQKIATFGGGSSFATWATAIATRKAIDELRRRHWKDVTFSQLIGPSCTADVVSAAAESDRSRDTSACDRRDMLSCMRHAIHSSLTDRQRTALVAKMLGMPLERIAAQLGSNRNAVHKLTHDARKKLKRAMAVAGYSEHDLRAAYAA